MIGRFTSPTDQAFIAMDIAYKEFQGDLEDQDYRLIGEAARLVMQTALESPDSPPAEWVGTVKQRLGEGSTMTLARLQQKADHARVPLEAGELVTDTALIERTINNGFQRPVKG